MWMAYSMFNYIKSILNPSKSLLFQLMINPLINLLLVFLQQYLTKINIITPMLTSFFVNELRYINALIFFIDIISLVLEYIIPRFIFLLCIIWAILYIYCDPCIYITFFICMVYLVIGICFLYISLMFLKNGLNAYQIDDFFSFILNSILFIILLLIAIIYITCGSYILYFYIPWRKLTQPPVQPNGNNGKGPWNGKPFPKWVDRGGNISEQDKNKREFLFLKSQEEMYQRTYDKAKKLAKKIKNRNFHYKNYGVLHPDCVEEQKRMADIRHASLLRLNKIRSWIKNHPGNK